MRNLKSELLIIYFLLSMLFGQTVALSDVSPIDETIANNTEYKQSQVDANEAISLQEIDLTNSIIDATVMIADRLEANQSPYGRGSWFGENDFTGSIVAGMVSAYELTGESAYKTSAERGGDYILNNYEAGFYGDEAFALARLNQIATPSDSQGWWIWRIAVWNFYLNIYAQESDYSFYISQFTSIEPSTAVFYLANHLVAAYYAGAIDKEIWREILIDYLAQIDDESSDFPVMALGVATWALAATGPLDDQLIDPLGSGADYWNNKELADLPYLLLSHQVPDGEPYAGSFYWRFDHGDGGSGGPVSGYTEDAIFATLGLISASRANSALDLETAILTAGQALLGSISNEGKVFEHLWLEGIDLYVFGGEMLHVLGELAAQQIGQAN